MADLPPATAAALDDAESLLARIDAPAEATAAAAEPKLFPRGVPVPLTVYALREAQIESLIHGADELARLDLEVGALEQVTHPERRRASLLSTPIAERLVKAEALKVWWAREGVEQSFALCAILFPNGEGRWLGLVDMLRAFRDELSGAISMTRDELSDATDADAEAVADSTEYLATMVEKGAWLLQSMAVAAGSSGPGAGSGEPSVDAYADA